MIQKLATAALAAGQSNQPGSAENHGGSDKALFGFWIYLMTDLVLFATLFATYMVLRGNTAGGAGAGELFQLPFVLVETIILLTSSFTSGLMLLYARAGQKRPALSWLLVTVALGAAFLGMELYEFYHLVHDGHGWTQSAFLSAFFTLVGTHGLHITAGIIWALTVAAHIIRSGLSAANLQRLTMFGMFWHFLDIVWIFIFTIVYLMGGH